MTVMGSNSLAIAVITVSLGTATSSRERMRGSKPWMKSRLALLNMKESNAQDSALFLGVGVQNKAGAA